MKFIEMSQEDFEKYQSIEIPRYAKENEKPRGMSKEEALEFSKKSFSNLLPNGINTPGHFFFKLEDETRIGTLWLFIREEKNRKSLFVYNIEIEENRRGKGFGKLAMQKVCEFAKEKNCQSVELHVFGHNLVARNLYTSLGFEPTSIVMKKTL